MSALAHALAVLLLLDEPPRVHRLLDSSYIELTLSERAPPDDRAPSLEPPARPEARAAEPSRPARTRAPREPSAEMRHSAADAVERAAPGHGEQGPEHETAPSPTSTAAAALLAAIDPRAVALSALAQCQTDDHPEAPVASWPDSCARDEAAAPVDEHARSLQDFVEDAARSVPHLRPRAPPKVRRRLDGTHVYEGLAFRATIQHDGHVEFEDKAGGIAGMPLGFSFDLTDLVEKHFLGKEIYAAEKRWFLEQTRELRMQLERQDRQRVLARGMQRLRGRLLSIIEDAARSPEQRRQAVFELWNECADDEVGSDAQRAIEAFVRDRMPQGSPLGYSERELAALNQRRAGRRPFDPYTAGA